MPTSPRAGHGSNASSPGWETCSTACRMPRVTWVLRGFRARWSRSSSAAILVVVIGVIVWGPLRSSRRRQPSHTVFEDDDRDSATMRSAAESAAARGDWTARGDRTIPRHGEGRGKLWVGRRHPRHDRLRVRDRSGAEGNRRSPLNSTGRETCLTASGMGTMPSTSRTTTAWWRSTTTQHRHA